MPSAEGSSSRPRPRPGARPVVGAGGKPGVDRLVPQDAMRGIGPADVEQLRVIGIRLTAARIRATQSAWAGASSLATNRVPIHAPPAPEREDRRQASTVGDAARPRHRRARARRRRPRARARASRPRPDVAAGLPALRDPRCRSRRSTARLSLFGAADRSASRSRRPRGPTVDERRRIAPEERDDRRARPRARPRLARPAA